MYPVDVSVAPQQCEFKLSREFEAETLSGAQCASMYKLDSTGVVADGGRNAELSNANESFADRREKRKSMYELDSTGVVAAHSSHQAARLPPALPMIRNLPMKFIKTQFLNYLVCRRLCHAHDGTD
jgi:hypothetical protein